MHQYRVGTLLIPGRTTWPETPEYGYRDGAHVLRLFYNEPTAEEIAAIKTGTAEFRAMAIGPILFFVYRFGTHPWGDAPFSWHMLSQQRPADATLPPQLQPGATVVLHIILVDASTGIIRALRIVSLDPTVAQYLHTAIRTQCSQPFDQDVYDATLAQVYATTTSAELAQRARSDLNL